MKRGVSLNQILTGNIKKKPKTIIPEDSTGSSLLSKGTINSNDLNSNETADTTAESIDLLGDNFLSSPLQGEPIISESHIIPVGNNVKSQTVKSFLLSKKPKEKPKEPIIISLDDDDNQIPNGSTSTQITKDITIVDEIFNLKNENISLQSRKISDPINTRKTRLKDIFSKFSKPSMIPNDEPIAYEGNSPLNRFHPASKLKFLELNFPKHQLIQPQDDIPLNNDTSLPLQKRTDHIFHSSQYIFDDNDYVSLNELNRNLEKSKFTKSIEYSIPHKNYVTLWPDLFKPNNIEEVLLEPALKTKVESWINEALKKLTKPTSRNRLLKTYKETFDEFAGFIVHEDEEETGESFVYNNAEMEEFIPLMILHGDGIGKDTLLHTIVNNLNGQIYEVNTSQNRSKKDILDILMEFCTTYYVKDKDVSGVVVISDVDVIFREHDKFFWLTVEKLLLSSRKPIVLTCKDINFVPRNLIEICESCNSLFHVKKVTSNSVVKFLEKYCKVLQLHIDEDLLEVIVNKNNRDIRKCLMELQFWFSSGNKIYMLSNELSNLKATVVDEIHEMSALLETNSQNNIVNYTIYNHSQIKQDVDNSLLTTDKLRCFQESTNDQYKWDNDYMNDYRIHLIDNNYQLLLPFEINMSEYVQNELFHKFDYLSTFNYNYPIKYSKLKNGTISFLESRVKPNNMITSTRVRRSRNSKVSEIMERFNGKYTKKTIDEEIVFDFAMTTKKHISEEIIPYVCCIAQRQEEAQRYNKQVYIECSRNLPPEKHTEMLQQLLEEDVLRKIWFHGNPSKLTECWK